MDISPLQRHIQVTDLPLEKLAGNSQVSQTDKIAEVSRQFEAILLRQILGSAQKTLFASSANPQSSSSAIYRDMVTGQLADTISHSNGIGLAESLTRQLGHELKLNSSAAATKQKL